MPVLRGFLPPTLQEKEEPPPSISLRTFEKNASAPDSRESKKKNQKISASAFSSPPERSPSTGRGWEEPRCLAELLVADAVLEREALSRARGHLPSHGLPAGRRDKRPRGRLTAAPLHERVAKGTSEGALLSSLSIGSASRTGLLALGAVRAPLGTQGTPSCSCPPQVRSRAGPRASPPCSSTAERGARGPAKAYAARTRAVSDRPLSLLS